MIRYPDALQNIEDAIDTQSAGWRAKAAARTALFRARHEYTEEITNADGTKRSLAPFWGDVKSVYVARQFHKCLYCEKRLEGKNFASVEWDLEHFRPKGCVRAWPPAKRKLKHDFALGKAGQGYYLLAYHVRNYGAACKTCNSPFKSDYFPVGAVRIASKDNPEDYAGEEAFLPYPLGLSDEDPEDLIRFDGARAEPCYAASTDKRKWQRGQVLIDFFGLNRDGLIEERAWWLLMAVWPNVVLAGEGKPDGVKNLDLAQSPKSPFTNCAKCFVRLCGADRAEAERKVAEFRLIVDTMER